VQGLAPASERLAKIVDTKKDLNVLKAAFESGLGFKQHEVQVDLIVVTKANTHTNRERRCVSTLSEELDSKIVETKSMLDEVNKEHLKVSDFTDGLNFEDLVREWWSRASPENHGS
jgi:hypothetical protein